MEVIPTILTKSYDDLKNKIALVRGVVPLVQIDIADGVYVQNYTWPFRSTGADREISELDYHAQAILNEQEGLPFWEDIDFEFDLMVCDAVENFDFYTRFGPKRVIFHLEAQRDLNAFQDFLEGIDLYIRETIQIGVAIKTTTPIENIFPIVPHIDFVQCMGIENVGFQGQDFDERVLEQIKNLKEKFPELVISVDGSVNTDTAPALVNACADRLVIGSAIFKTSDIIGTVEMFENLI
ncbi:MAG: hypothetical protein NTZ44_00090 [Candidatus Nomurabacteria bacterium]|nr:hypothetical protein [Candidatus Nomurabacteria bacterium]